MEYYDLDLVTLAEELAEDLGEEITVQLFGSRKYPGKTRSDLDLLVAGPSGLEALNAFRDSRQHYQPLDLWLQTGDSAVSAVTGSVLRVADLRSRPLYPEPDEGLAQTVRVQRFRSDIDYKMSVAPPRSDPMRQRPALDLASKIPGLLDPSPFHAAQAVVQVLDAAVNAVDRMRDDGNARRGKGTQLRLLTEYDFQNLTELVLAPLIPLEREAYVVRESGKDRTVDFSLAQGKVALELKLAKTSSELNSELKDAHGVLDAYLNHPGVEVALAVIAIKDGFRIDRNAIHSWSQNRDANRRALVRTIIVPSRLCTSDG
ncbi:MULTISPECIES: hypothetical protein [unclassified Curtobacterium]|uniref:PD-(D/E)XK nuclease domain-containing protein n=1 Tax=unclassified Curtobacterium TaxID=257496 RepID=UPI0039AF86FA